MEQKRPNKRPQKLDTQGIRGLVFALAVSATIGFWAIFSRVDAIQPSGADELDPSANGMSEVQDENVNVLDLPPIPTLVPISNPSFLSQPVTALNIPVAINDGTSNLNQPLVSPPSPDNKPVKDQSKPEKPKKVKEKKTTSTKSS